MLGQRKQKPVSIAFAVVPSINCSTNQPDDAGQGVRASQMVRGHVAWNVHKTKVIGGRQQNPENPCHGCLGGRSGITSDILPEDSQEGEPQETTRNYPMHSLLSDFLWAFLLLWPFGFLAGTLC